MTADDLLEAVRREHNQLRSLGQEIQYHEAIQAQLREDMQELLKQGQLGATQREQIEVNLASFWPFSA
jgi:hypothetical protein